MQTTTTRRHRREKIVDLIPNGPEADLKRVKAAIASIRKAAIYWVGAKAIVAWNDQARAWLIQPADPGGDATRQASQRELVRALALAFIDEGLAVSVPPQA
jgi:hypothetical protein